MSNLNNFFNTFNGFDDLFINANLQNFNIFYYGNSGFVAKMFRVIGCTVLKDDYLLHLIKIYHDDEFKTPTNELLERCENLEFILLSQLIGESGFSITPIK